MKMDHREWNSIYKEQPVDGARVVSRRAGDAGYCGDGVYDAASHTIRTYVDCRNRLEITIWKHDEWYYKPNSDLGRSKEEPK